MNYLSAIFKRSGSRYPSEYQLSTWENDGGFHSVMDEAVIINGHLCYGWVARLRCSFAHMMKQIKIRLFGTPKQTER